MKFRSTRGRFTCRDRFYTISDAVREEYTRRTVEYLEKPAKDLDLDLVK